MQHGSGSDLRTMPRGVLPNRDKDRIRLNLDDYEGAGEVPTIRKTGKRRRRRQKDLA